MIDQKALKKHIKSKKKKARPNMFGQGLLSENRWFCARACVFVIAQRVLNSLLIIPLQRALRTAG